jgi:hypothetical protein
MPEKLEEFKRLPYLMVEESLEKGHPLYDIEEELQKWVILHAEFFLDRYRRGIGKHWTENELVTTRLGLCGQKIFELMLQLMEVPYVPNDPVIDQRLTKSYDFKIPKLGTIEIKTYAHYCKKVLIKPSEWHGNDYLVVWQMNKKQDRLRMIGWLPKEEVEAVPTTKKGESRFNPYADAMIIDMTNLRPPKTFITKLQKVKQVFDFV